MAILDTLKQILAYVIKAYDDEVLDVSTFFIEAAQYAARNIKPEFLKIVTDCMTAAEQAFSGDASVDRYELAFSNIIAALEKDGIEYAEADVNYAVEVVIQQRNARQVAENPTPDTTPAS